MKTPRGKTPHLNLKVLSQQRPRVSSGKSPRSPPSAKILRIRAPELQMQATQQPAPEAVPTLNRTNFINLVEKYRQAPEKRRSFASKELPASITQPIKPSISSAEGKVGDCFTGGTSKPDHLPIGDYRNIRFRG
jgi:hypothetical protein